MFRAASQSASASAVSVTSPSDHGHIPGRAAANEADRVSERPRAAAFLPIADLSDGGARASANATPSPASEVEDVMRLVYANSARPELYKDLWAEVAKFSDRHDHLSLRSVSTDMSTWMDKSITSIECEAREAAETLAAVANAVNLKHIDSLQISNCSDAHLPAVIAALAALPPGLLAAMDVSLVGQRSSWRAFGGVPIEPLALMQLRGLAPASLRFANVSSASPEMAFMLADLDYPIHFAMSRIGDILPNATIEALARIPQLVSLDVTVNSVSDDSARALGEHRALTTLRFSTPWAIDISNAALTALANSTTLRTLHLEGTRHPFGDDVVAALAENRTLERLILKGISRFFGESFAVALAANTTLKTLRLPIMAGAGHFAHMPSLRHLMLSGRVNVTDARELAQHANLKSLNCGHVQFEDGALAEIAKTTVRKFTLTADIALDEEVLTDAAVDAFLGNGKLRSLTCYLPAGPNTDITHAVRLAAHPTLRSLSISYAHPPGEDGAYRSPAPEPTPAQDALLLAAWGTHRPADALVVRM